jgi:hypothetical protein
MPTTEHPILAVTAAIALFAGAAHANALTDSAAFPEVNAALTQSNPEIVLKLHGFLSRAQFECGFRSYSQTMTDFAVAAAAQMPSERAVSVLMADGMKSFDLGATQSSLRSACAAAAKAFPTVVRP